MNIRDLLHITRPLHVQGHFDGEPLRLRIDSRSVEEHDVFIALRGTTSDGHHYIDDAVRRGARVIIAESIPDICSGKEPVGTPEKSEQVLFLQVADTRHIVGELAQAFAGYPARSMKMIGVTGTNGKTTVSTLVYQVLKRLGYNTGLLGTVEIRMDDRVTSSRLTTPDPVTLATILDEMAERDTAFTVMEVSSHALDQRRVGGIRFDVAAFTNLSQDHLDYHRDMDAYIEAKQQLFSMLEPGAVAIMNRDDPAWHRMVSNCRSGIWEFGFKDDRDFRILDERPEGMVLDLEGTIVSTPLTGRYNAYNVAQAYLICLALGCAKTSVAIALGEAPGAPGRLERIKPSRPMDKKQMFPTVLVDYAHTPDALENVLDALYKVRGEEETLHVVFGCGGDRDRTKRPEMGHVADRYADVITLTSDNPRTEEPDMIIRGICKGITRTDSLFTEPDRRKAIRSAILEADTKTVILIAGKGHETHQEVHGRRNTFDDRVMAQKALNEWIERRLPRKNRSETDSEKEVC